MALGDEITTLIKRFHTKIAANVVSNENKDGVLEITQQEYNSLFEADLETLQEFLNRELTTQAQALQALKTAPRRVSENIAKFLSDQQKVLADFMA